MCESLAFGLVDAWGQLMVAQAVLTLLLGLLGAALFHWLRELAFWLEYRLALRRCRRMGAGHV